MSCAGYSGLADTRVSTDATLRKLLSFSTNSALIDARIAEEDNDSIVHAKHNESLFRDDTIAFSWRSVQVLRTSIILQLERNEPTAPWNSTIERSKRAKCQRSLASTIRLKTGYTKTKNDRGLPQANVEFHCSMAQTQR